MPMYPEIKERWVAALRSGEHIQTREALMDDQGYCCLGVLEKLYCEEHDVIMDDDNYDDGLLLKETMDWAGLQSSNPKVFVGPGHECADDAGKVCLSAVNDELEYDFKEIANLIEADKEI